MLRRNTLCAEHSNPELQLKNVSTLVYENILSDKELVEKSAEKLSTSSWEEILNNVEYVINYCEKRDSEAHCISLVHGILDIIEDLIDKGQFIGDSDRAFFLIDRCSYSRPEKSVFNLMQHLFASTQMGSDWVDGVGLLMTRYYVNDTRPNVRIQAMQLFQNVFFSRRMVYEQELVRFTLKYFSNVGVDSNDSVKTYAVQMLVDIALQCTEENALKILEILEQVMYRLFECGELAHVNVTCIQNLIKGLVDIFLKFLNKWPCITAMKSLSLLVIHLQMYYSRPKMLEFDSSVRIMVIQFLSKLAMDSQRRLCFDNSPRNTKLLFSPYIIIDESLQKSPNALSNFSPLYAIEMKPSSDPEDDFGVSYWHVSLSPVCNVITTAIIKENNWTVLQVILHSIPKILKNGALVSSEDSISQLLAVVFNLVADKSSNVLESLKNAPEKFTYDNFLENVFPILSNFVSFNINIESPLQLQLIKCLEFGLVSKTAPLCVNALTLCILEMSNVMVKLLPEVLLNLSKISSAVRRAVPLLEFLSMLTNFPEIFANFVPDQYMAILAISLPYTNPFKYNRYILLLAHYVISAWFLRSNVSLRRDFVKYIINGLKSNMLLPFAESCPPTTSEESKNEDSANRKRCSSFIERGSRSKEQGAPQGADTEKFPVHGSFMVFHRELTEICIDLMSRYAFTTCSMFPKKHPSSSFILEHSQSMTWLVGTKLITVTTAACSGKPIRGNLCDRCSKTCVLSTDASDLEEYPVSEDVKDQVCTCWCQGWAEIRIRRPTGDTAWLMCIQNEQTGLNHDHLLDVGTLTLPSFLNKCLAQQKEFGNKYGDTVKRNTDNQTSASHVCSENVSDEEDAEAFIADEPENGRSRNPVCRSNSSPEMNSSWKLPFLSEENCHTLDNSAGDKKGRREFRHNCEAIPEEISGLSSSPPVGHLMKCRVQDVKDQKSEKIPSVGIDDKSKWTDVGTKSLPSSPTKKAPDSEMHDSDKFTQSSVSSGRIKDQFSVTSTSAQSSTQHGSSSDINYKRYRHYTVSVMNSTKPQIPGDSAKQGVFHRGKENRSGITPSFVFLQLYHSAQFGMAQEKPLLLPQNMVLQRSLNVFDKIPPYETYKVGIIYIDPGQANLEKEILTNRCGSLRYVSFLQKLGTLVKLSDVDPQHVFLGGLDRYGCDGTFTYVWITDIMQMAFHVATLMPTKSTDPNCSNKKKAHIGNNYVTIAYNNSGEDFIPDTIQCQFNLACIVIEPLNGNKNRVTVKMKRELIELIGEIEPKIVSDESVSVLARQLALHTSLASKVICNTSCTQREETCESNWLERLRKIKSIRKKVFDDMNSESTGNHGANSSNSSGGPSTTHSFQNSIIRKMNACDFTDYT